MEGPPFNEAKYKQRITRAGTGAIRLGLLTRYALSPDATEALIEQRLKEVAALWRREQHKRPIFTQFVQADAKGETTRALRDRSQRERHRIQWQADQRQLFAPLREAAEDAAFDGQLSEADRTGLQQRFTHDGFSAEEVDLVLREFPALPRLTWSETTIDRLVPELERLNQTLPGVYGMSANATLKEWEEGVLATNFENRVLSIAEKNCRENISRILKHALAQEGIFAVLNGLGARAVRYSVAPTQIGRDDQKTAKLAALARAAGAREPELLVRQVIADASESGNERQAALRREEGARAVQLKVQRRLCAAREELIALSVLAPELDLGGGRSLKQELDELDVALASALEKVKTAEASLRQDSDKAFALCEAALRIAADLDEAHRLRAQCAPKPPAQAEAKLHGHAARLTWSASPSDGQVVYRVVRQQDAPALAPDSGTVVAETRQCSAEDPAVPPGVRFFYSVFSARVATKSAGESTALAQTWSQPASTQALVWCSDVHGLQLRAGDRSVHATWPTLPPNARRAVVARSARPSRWEDATPVRATPNGFDDFGLQNDTVYYYRIQVEYETGGGALENSPGVVEWARPVPLPVAPALSSLSVDAGRVTVRATPPERGRLGAYRSHQAPRWQPGQLVRTADLRALHALQATTNTGEFVDSSPITVAWYQVAVIDGDTAALGKPSSFLNVANVEDLQVQDLQDYLEVSWRWPAGCDRVRVAWRLGTPPVGPADPQASKLDWGKGDYRQHGGMKLKVASGDWHVIAYALAELNGEEQLASGVAARSIANGGSGSITYQVENVGPLFRRRHQLSLVADRDYNPAPNLVLIARRGGTQPTSVQQGNVVARFEGLRLVKGERFTLPLSLDSVPRPSYLRLFAAHPGDSVRLHAPAVEQLRLT